MMRREGECHCPGRAGSRRNTGPRWVTAWGATVARWRAKGKDKDKEKGKDDDDGRCYKARLYQGQNTSAVFIRGALACYRYCARQVPRACTAVP